MSELKRYILEVRAKDTKDGWEEVDASYFPSRRSAVEQLLSRVTGLTRGAYRVRRKERTGACWA